MISTIPQLLLAAIVGMIMGGVYFGSLWLTLRRLPETRHAALLAIASLLLRMLVLVGVFYLLFGDNWEQLVVALLGLLLVRTLMIRRIKPEAQVSHGEQGGGQ